ncbi:hypothetical protein lerEdw1_015952 [Lerista edwardsae]|nr:hypothetical protein lerEdw1_015952 [Lerista edwardsae]
MALLTSLCLLSILICGSFLEAKALNCDRGWMEDQGNCYAFFQDKVTWFEAEIQCQSYGPGTHLASVLTVAETELVATYIANFPNVNTGVWIGLFDARRNRKWRWSDGSLFNYKAWKKNEPNNAGGSENCVELWLASKFREWNDVSCQSRKGYICKYRI